MASTAADTGLSGAVHGPVYTSPVQPCTVYSTVCTARARAENDHPRPRPLLQPRVGRGMATRITGERCTLLTLTLPSCWLQEVDNINTDDVMAAMKINKMNC